MSHGKIAVFVLVSLAICVQVDSSKFNIEELTNNRRSLALDVARLLKDPSIVAVLSQKLTFATPSLDMLSFLQEVARFPLPGREQWISGVLKLDFQLREYKGITDKVDSLLQIRLAIPERGFQNNFLVAYRPGSHKKTWKSVEAFDTEGNSHKLDSHQVPAQQVLVVGIDSKKDMKAGMEVVNEKLREAGMQPTQRNSTNLKAGLAVAKLDHIRLEDDKEPWIEGDSEIYALVNGISPESEKASIISVELPYLVTDKKDYYPGQVFIVWDNYRYKAANINFFEHDDNTSYQEIVATLIAGIGLVVPEYKAIIEVAAAIIRLMPAGLFTNSDDYVDVFYTLENLAYVDYPGVSGNCKLTLVPYTIQE